MNRGEGSGRSLGLLSSNATGDHSTPGGYAAADFDRCSTAENARGPAPKRAVQYTFVTVAILVRTIATTAAIARRLLSS